MNFVVDNAIQKAMAATAADDGGSLPELVVRVKLSARFASMIRDLTGTLGLSARTVYNSALRYAVRTAAARRISVADLPEYPRRLRGTETSYLMSIETRHNVLVAQEQGEFDVARATLAGLTLLHGRLHVANPVGRPRKTAVAQ